MGAYSGVGAYLSKWVLGEGAYSGGGGGVIRSFTVVTHNTNVCLILLSRISTTRLFSREAKSVSLSFCLEHVNFRLRSNTYSKTKESKDAFRFARKNSPSGNPPLYRPKFSPRFYFVIL